jgi:hypothetical protein
MWCGSGGSRSPCHFLLRLPCQRYTDPAARPVAAVRAQVCGTGTYVSLLTYSTATSGKKQAAKSKEELAQEKKKELEKRLQDVSGQLNSKKPTKKGNH